jgi:hypothetical protein
MRDAQPKEVMDQRRETPGRNPILKDLLYLFICGCLFVAATLAWKHFHREDVRQDDLKAHEKAQSLTDH